MIAAWKKNVFLAQGYGYYSYVDYYYKKCLEIIYQIIRFLENALIESKIIFKNDVDIFQYKKLQF